MKVAAGRGKVSYEVHFHAPSFDIGANSAATLEALYSVFGTAFQGLSLSDVSTVPGPPLSAANFAVNLLEGMATARLWLDRYSLDLNILRPPTVEDVTTALTIAACIESAISRVTTNVLFRNANVGVAQWYQVSGDVALWLEQRGRPNGDDLTNALGAEVAEYTAALRVRNNSELWAATFVAEPSRVSPWQLFINYNGTYIHSGKYQNAQTQSEHVNWLFTTLFEKWGLETPDLSGTP